MSDQATIARPDARSIDIRRRFPASAALMWRMFTDPAHFSRWWGPEGAACTRCEIDLRPGGAWETVLSSPAMGDMPVGGVYREVDEPSRVSFTWAWRTGENPHQSVVTIEFTEIGDECEVRVLHTDLAEEQAEDHLKGWTSSFNCLAAEIAKTA